MEIVASELLPYFTTVIGFLIVYVLNGIKAEITDVKTSVKNLEVDLRDGITTLDRRVTRLETKCDGTHGRD